MKGGGAASEPQQALSSPAHPPLTSPKSPMANCDFSPVSGNKPCCRLSTKAQVGLGVGVLLLIIPVVAVAVVAGVRGQRAPLEWNGAGTTKHFSEIFLGRCFVYTQIIRPELRNKDCTQILAAFKGAFISKNPCNITIEDYQPLIQLDTEAVPCNKTLFWSKSKDLAHQYTWVHGDMFTLEDTLLGYIADDLTWCGDPSTSEVNEQSCPHWKKDHCPDNPAAVFWKMVSQKFAEAACGVVQVMLNGSLNEPFYKNSTFGSVELFNLNPKRVHTLQAWVMHDIDGVRSNSCSRPSIHELKLMVMSRNITFVCQENYRPVQFVQCVKNPENSFCKL